MAAETAADEGNQRQERLVECEGQGQHIEVGIALAVEGEHAARWRPAAFDGLVVLGGEQSALDDHTHAYLPSLARLMRDFGSRDKAVLGICLGSQILARAYGAQNLLGTAPEFGWQKVPHRGRQG